MLLHFIQPMTASQIAYRMSIDRDSCSSILSGLLNQGIVQCLTPKTRRSRLYWLTDLGAACLKQLHKSIGTPTKASEFPDVDWELYSWVCFSHRATIVKTLIRPLQPSQIKRQARFNDPTLRMSANNVRDVIRLFLVKEIVRAVDTPGFAHPRYELTTIGERLQLLLFRARSTQLTLNTSTQEHSQFRGIPWVSNADRDQSQIQVGL